MQPQFTDTVRRFKMWSRLQEPSGRDAQWAARKATLHHVHTAFGPGDAPTRLPVHSGCGSWEPELQQGEYCIGGPGYVSHLLTAYVDLGNWRTRTRWQTDGTAQRTDFISKVQPTRCNVFSICLFLPIALHVSGGSSAHHQEHKTVHTASGIVKPILCTVLCSWWWAEEAPETCRAICRNKQIEETLHLVGCTLEIYLAIHGHMNGKNWLQSLHLGSPTGNATWCRVGLLQGVATGWFLFVSSAINREKSYT